MEKKVRSFEKRSSRYNLRPFHDKKITYTCKKNGLQESLDFVDISSTGLGFIVSANQVPELNEVIHITFSIPELDVVTVQARVARFSKYERPNWYKRFYDEDGNEVEEYIIGVEFLTLAPSEAVALESHIIGLSQRERLERKIRYYTYVKDGFKTNIVWIIISVIAIFLLRYSLKSYFG